MIDTVKLTPEYLNNPLTDTNRFYNDCRARNLSPGTSKQYTATVVKYLKITGTEQFRKEAEYTDYKPHLMKFLEVLRREEISYSHTKAQFTALTAFFFYLIDDGFITENPVPKFRARYVREYKTPEPASCKVCTPAEVRVLIKTAKSALWGAIIITLVVTGLRRSELIALNVGDIDFENRIIQVHRHKKRSNCLVPFTEEALSFILDYLEFRLKLGHELNDDDPLFLGSQNIGRIGGEVIRLNLQRIGRRCNLHNDLGREDERLIPHSFRHTFTTLLKEAGMNSDFIAECRGDKRQKSQDAYYRIKPERLRDEYDKYAPRILQPFYTLPAPAENYHKKGKIRSSGTLAEA